MIDGSDVMYVCGWNSRPHRFCGGPNKREADGSDVRSEARLCHCLCGANHRDDLGVCTNEATGVLRFSDFPSSSALAGLESVDVRMCQPCREATLRARTAASDEKRASDIAALPSAVPTTFPNASENP